MPNAIDSLLFADATAQAEEIRSGRVSATELTQAYLDAIDRIDGSLRSYVTVTADAALAAARAADARIREHEPGEPLPPFLGVSVSFKDVVDVAGVPTTHSCKLLAGDVAEADSPIVRGFRSAGFVILGKTNVPEFCTTMTDSELNGTCRNPWDLERTPGGSSGGAAAALSAGLCAVAHGTDGAGSVRVPAAFCGLVGVKATRGLLTHGPEEGDAYYGTAENGVLTRSVRDVAGILDVLTATPWSPATGRSHTDAAASEPGRLRVAVCLDPPMGTIDPECPEAARETGALLKSLGHDVVEATPPWMTILAMAAGPMEVPGMAGRVALDDVESIEPRNRPVLRRLTELRVTEHASWVEQTRRATREFCRFWDDVDVLVTPTCGIPAPSVSFATWDQTPEEHIATFMSFPNFAQPFNLSGQPALSLPLASHSSGLPIGVQLVGRHLEEPTLLALAAQLEAARPWGDRRPSLPV
jgi:amidase